MRHRRWLYLIVLLAAAFTVAAGAHTESDTDPLSWEFRLWTDNGPRQTHRWRDPEPYGPHPLRVVGDPGPGCMAEAPYLCGEAADAYLEAKAVRAMTEGGGDVDPEPPDDCTPNGCNPQVCGGMDSTPCGHFPLFWCYDGKLCICGGTVNPEDGIYICWCYCSGGPQPNPTEGATVDGRSDTLRLRVAGEAKLVDVLDSLEEKGPWSFEYSAASLPLARHKHRVGGMQAWNVSSSDYLIRDVVSVWGLRVIALQRHRYLIDVPTKD